MAINILFVCTGNTCRSSMAEGIAFHLIGEGGEKYRDLWVASAGIYALEGLPAAEQAILVSAEEGIDLKEHQTSMITPQLIEEADIILTMTKGHKEHLLQIMPSATGKIFLLKEYIGDSKKAGDISDPFGQGIEVYRSSFHELRQIIEQALEKIIADKPG